MSNLTSAIRNEHGTKPRGIVRCVPVNMSFRAEPQFVGSVICGVGLAFHGDAFAAGPYDYPVGNRDDRHRGAAGSDDVDLDRPGPDD